MNRRRTLARILALDGLLLLVVAVLYFALTDRATQWLTSILSPSEYSEVAPHFLLNHISIGVLLVPLALTTLCAAWGVKKGQGWSRIVSFINGISLLALPAVFWMSMGSQYYSFVLSLAAILIVVIGITMLVPAIWFPQDTIESKHDVNPEEHPDA
jgi:hypothetical protein